MIDDWLIFFELEAEDAELRQKYSDPERARREIEAAELEETEQARP